MSLNTHSKFYFGFEVTSDALFIDFDEGGGEIAAELPIGAYTLTEFANVLATAMSDAGGQDYAVTVDRDTRKFTISAAAAFELLVFSGSHIGTTAFGLAGFSGADTGSATSHESTGGAGSVYTTQFVLQSYVAPEHYKNSTYGTVNKSASGKIEVVSYGIERFVQADIKYANDNDNGGSVIRFNPTGVSDLTTFMVFLTSKAPLEFIPDEDDPGTFISVVLESTADDAKGLKFKLKEMYGDGLPGYFSTGALTFRVLDDE
jgi:hypothetical protein